MKYSGYITMNSIMTKSIWLNMWNSLSCHTSRMCVFLLLLINLPPLEHAYRADALCDRVDQHDHGKADDVLEQAYGCRVGKLSLREADVVYVNADYVAGRGIAGGLQKQRLGGIAAQQAAAVKYQHHHGYGNDGRYIDIAYLLPYRRAVDRGRLVYFGVHGRQRRDVQYGVPAGVLPFARGYVHGPEPLRLRHERDRLTAQRPDKRIYDAAGVQHYIKHTGHYDGGNKVRDIYDCLRKFFIALTLYAVKHKRYEYGNGKIDDKEIRDFKLIQDQLKQMEETIHSLQLWIEHYIDKN